MGLKANGRTQSHSYLRSPGNERTGVWRAEPATTGPHTPKYSEFTYLLEGAVTLVDADGRRETLKAGDAVLVPRGTTYTWQQAEPLREFWVIFDNPAPATEEMAAPAAMAASICLGTAVRHRRTRQQEKAHDLPGHAGAGAARRLRRAGQ